MRIFRGFLLVAALVLVAGCASKFRSYDGPEVTSVVVQKAARRIYLLNGSSVLRAYDMDLGFAPVGDKKVEGDGKTPEGQYIVDRRNPNSLYHLSIGINYPSPDDIAEASAMGQEPGGDIFIHGRGRGYRESRGGRDWTAGCISVSDDEIEEIYAMVRDGTPIFLQP